MRRYLPRVTIGRLMIAVALVAPILAFVARAHRPPEPPSRRLVEVIVRDARGRHVATEYWGYNLKSPARARAFREQVARLKARKFEFKVTSPRGFTPSLDPIY